MQTPAEKGQKRTNSRPHVAAPERKGIEKEVDCYLEKAEKLWRKHLGDGGEFALSDLVPFVSVGGERLRP